MQKGSSFINTQDKDGVSSLSRKMSKVTVKKMPKKAIKVDQELKLERELRVAVIDGTGSTAL